MNFTELKALAKKLGGIVVVSGDRPELVILPYNTYRQLETSQPEIGPLAPTAPAEDGAEIERLNREILTLKEEIRQKEEAEMTEAEPETPENI